MVPIRCLIPDTLGLGAPESKEILFGSPFMDLIYSDLV